MFNAPIGGAMFALEVITGELTPAFGAVILASVSATVVSRSLFGNFPSFVVPRYDLVSTRELLAYIALGLLTGLASVAFIRMLYASEDAFDDWHLPTWIKPAIGGLMIGIIGRFLPQVFGTGADTIQAATWGTLAPLLLLLLIPMKMVATSLTLASGGSGGVFGPSMYIGAMLGGAFGAALHTIWPDATAGSGAYALVGIGGVVGGTAMAPLTAIILLFEMTDDYRIILPVMVVTALSVVVTRTLVGESIYTLKLRRQDIGYYAAAEIERIHGTTVAAAMRADVPLIPSSMSVVGGLAAAVQARTTALPVGNEDDEVVGAVTVTQLAGAAVLDERPASVAELAIDLSRVRIREQCAPRRGACEARRRRARRARRDRGSRRPGTVGRHPHPARRPARLRARDPLGPQLTAQPSASDVEARRARSGTTRRRGAGRAPEPPRQRQGAVPATRTVRPATR